MSFQTITPVLYSEDVRRSIRYYTEILGFDCKWEWEDPPTFGGVSKDGVEIFFCEKGQGNRGTWISIFIDDVDVYYEEIKAKGAIIRLLPETMPWGLREMTVEDPDGHCIRFGHRTSHHHGFFKVLGKKHRIVERTPTAEEYNNLFNAVGWNHTQRGADLAKVLAAPVFTVVAEDSDTGKAIGCALLLGDNASFYYVKDVMVHPQWQGKQVGTEMMEAIKNWLQQHAPHNALVGLYTGGNLSQFYKQFGFRHAFGMSMRIQKPDQ